MTIDSATSARTLRLQVENVIEETSDAVTLVLSTSDTDRPAPFDYRPGQFLTLEIPHEEDRSVARCYSISSSPDCDDRPAISVKRTPGGYASNWLCDNAAVGLTLSALRPAGSFVPSRWDKPLVLVAAGSGITPVLSILKTALAVHHERVVLIYANRSAESVMFADTLDDLVERHPTRLEVIHWLESDRGMPTATGLRNLMPSSPASDAYLCGPAVFMDLAHDALVAAGLSPDAIYREVFTSIQANPFHTSVAAPPTATDVGTPVTAEVEGEDYTFHCPPDTVLLDAMLDHGIDAPFVCREGNCGACAFTLKADEVEMRVNDTLDTYELGEGVRLACQSVPVSGSIDMVIE
ncbi:ferredoxin--NADP reductase [Gordonia rubripertincta]|uniref:Ferredoxin--NADP reductase n=1 Tax=Gordonia rubripertincta TaxID=36822 RepID=A0ABT4MQJ7_GORRU|nr:ferredoxin--NADP reductase [Gordonia rubripertincta]MCZ4548581.1 ferredoxin--NADP reductase [Gordonia rubripertincta]